MSLSNDELSNQSLDIHVDMKLSPPPGLSISSGRNSSTGISRWKRKHIKRKVIYSSSSDDDDYSYRAPIATKRYSPRKTAEFSLPDSQSSSSSDESSSCISSRNHTGRHRRCDQSTTKHSSSPSIRDDVDEWRQDVGTTKTEEAVYACRSFRMQEPMDRDGSTPDPHRPICESDEEDGLLQAPFSAPSSRSGSKEDSRIQDTTRENRIRETRTPIKDKEHTDGDHHYQLPTGDPRRANMESDEDDLLEAAFFEPCGFSTRKQDSRMQRTKSAKQNPRRVTRTPVKNVEVVDLCGDSSDDEQDGFEVEQQHQAQSYPSKAQETPRVGGATVHEGLKVPARSPGFNNIDYGFDRATEVPPTASLHASPQREDDDIVDCWSSDENYGGTNLSQCISRTRRRSTAQIDSSNQLATICRPTNGDESIGSHIPTSSGVQSSIQGNNSTSATLSQSLLPERWTSDRTRKRRRMRNATDPTLAEMAVPRDQQDRSSSNRASTFVNTGAGVSYRQQESHSNVARGNATERNDLTGGSGASVGGHDVMQSDYASRPAQSEKRPASRGGRTKKNYAKSKKGRNSWGNNSGRGRWYKKKGNNNKENNSRYNGRNRNNRSDEPYMEISRQDPQLKHVGGANIIF